MIELLLSLFFLTSVFALCKKHHCSFFSFSLFFHLLIFYFFATACEDLKNCCDCLTPGKAGTSFLCEWQAKKNVIVGPNEDGTGECVVVGGKKRSAYQVESEFVLIKTVAMCPCGDGNTCKASLQDKGCDLGNKLNGKPGSCCTADCKIVTKGSMSRLSILWPTNESEFSCARRYVNQCFCSVAVCRDVANPVTCDRPETCDGVSPLCPADGFWFKGKVTTHEETLFLPTKLSSHPPTVHKKRTSNVCYKLFSTRPPTMCVCLLRSTITRNRKIQKECRPKKNDCDDAEVCSGTDANCPADIFKAAGTVCRVRKGDCDIAEVCDENGNVNRLLCSEIFGSTVGKPNVRHNF